MAKVIYEFETALDARRRLDADAARIKQQTHDAVLVAQAEARGREHGRHEEREEWKSRVGRFVFGALVAVVGAFFVGLATAYYLWP